MATRSLVLYIIRRDLRIADNPILHQLSTEKSGFTNLLPLYVLDSRQIETSGFLKPGQKNPFDPARSKVLADFWRCGEHRAKFIAQSVWNMKENLKNVGSDLYFGIGSIPSIVEEMIQCLATHHLRINAVWMTEEPAYEEVQDQRKIASICEKYSVQFKLWTDEKYLVDDRDTGLDTIEDLPNVFSTYYKMHKTGKSLRDKPREVLPAPQRSSLPSLLPEALLTPSPFDDRYRYPDTLDELMSGLLKPLEQHHPMGIYLPLSEGAPCGHLLQGGENFASQRLHDVIRNGVASAYHETRNGLIGDTYSTRLSAHLAQGCITARQIHHELVKYEEGKDDRYLGTLGYGDGENKATENIRYELLWRDYMRLATKKFGSRLFSIHGFQGKDGGPRKNGQWKGWKQPTGPQLRRFLRGVTGIGLIDASQRELFHTGYTSNRARQNVASFWSKAMGLDWRIGAAWYEMLLVDYDVSSNWGNWQYVAGVGNDPRPSREFNPVKQGFDYDKEGIYVRTWVHEVRHLHRLENVFQVWTTSTQEKIANNLLNDSMAMEPIHTFIFNVNHKAKRSGTQRRRPGLGPGWGRGGGGGEGGRPPPGPEQAQPGPADQANAIAPGCTGYVVNDIAVHESNVTSPESPIHKGPLVVNGSTIDYLMKKKAQGFQVNLPRRLVPLPREEEPREEQPREEQPREEELTEEEPEEQPELSDGQSDSDLDEPALGKNTLRYQLFRVKSMRVPRRKKLCLNDLPLLPLVPAVGRSSRRAVSLGGASASAIGI